MEKKKTSGFAIAALVLGIIGVVFSFIPIINNVAFILAILAIVFGIIGVIKSSGKAMAIVAIVLSVLAIIITISMQAAVGKLIDNVNDSVNSLSSSVDDMTGKNTEKILAEYADVKIDEFTAVENSYITETKLPVTVKNKSAEKKSFSIHIVADDATGNRIDDDYVYVSDLLAGQTQEFKCFAFVSSEKMEKLKAAKFSIIEISMT